ncbi:MAG: hypothetical protein ACJAZP_002327 [Psychromonas sp.]|jgi:hypothetical protein|uniref:hypothetical protein n=1 Tax=Psychromonas sp. TaxID=1884585 RepID=UPI0039E2CEEA
MKGGAIICTALFVLAVLLSLVQMWFSIMETALFWKLLITLGAFFIVALGITLVCKEYLSEKELKKKGYLD